MINKKEYIAAAIAWHSSHIAQFSGAHPLSDIEDTIHQTFGVTFERSFFEQALEYAAGLGWLDRFDDPFTEPFFVFNPEQVATAYRGANNRESAIYRARELGRPWLTSALTTLSENVAIEVEEKGSFAPAADRVVLFDDNLKAATQATLDEIIANLTESNSAIEELGEEKDRVVSELNAGKELTKSNRIRVRAIAEILLKPLRFLAEKFSEGAIGALAAALIVELLKVL